MPLINYNLPFPYISMTSNASLRPPTEERFLDNANFANKGVKAVLIN